MVVSRRQRAPRPEPLPLRAWREERPTPRRRRRSRRGARVESHRASQVLRDEHLTGALLLRQLVEGLHDVVAPQQDRVDCAGFDEIADLAPERVAIERLDPIEEWTIDGGRF